MNGLHVYPDVVALARAAARGFVAAAKEALALRGRFVVALAGGSTPAPTYRLLASEEFAARVDWGRVHVFWGDERCVSLDHPDSNYRMARETLLESVSIPAPNVHPIRCQLPPAQAAAAYRAELQAVLGSEARFDLIFLGLGEDGHTASLFPGTSVLAEQERAAAAVWVPRLKAWRVTLTFPVLNAARQVVFLVTGAAKGPALARIESGESLPAARICPSDGELAWLVDRPAIRRARESMV